MASSTEIIQERANRLNQVTEAVHTRVVGQEETVEGLLIALLTGGHVILEGLPGLAKTLMVRSLAEAIHTSFRRIQFTPDLLPGDIIGTPVYHQGTGEFRVQKGPIFSNILLADEVNRAPPKVQAALLEAMEEAQVTIAGDTYPLKQPFLVLATQNPVELKGTYPLAEAQLDRFMMKLIVGYPDREEEAQIIRKHSDRRLAAIERPLSEEAILEIRKEVHRIHLDDRVLNYILDLIFATREPESCGLDELAPMIEFGASPRASLFLARTARARAYLNGRDFVLPDDVKAMVLPVFRHRLRLTYEAEAKGITSDDVIARVLRSVPTP